MPVAINKHINLGVSNGYSIDLAQKNLFVMLLACLLSKVAMSE